MSDLIVQTLSGAVQGKKLSDACVAWLGIPYAEAPVGPLRFRPPLPVAAWRGTFRADRFGSAATQVHFPDMGSLSDFYDDPPQGGLDVVGSEDCLSLNIWAPASDGKKRPVYVWIHGGANHLESARLPIYHGDSLAVVGDIIVVSFNYRLGLFGFMDVEPILGADYRGAYTNGLKDQLLALQWIKANIAAFGGDPDQITLGGESAGGMNVSWLLASGRLKGLVQRAVIMSDVGGPAGLGGDGPRYRHAAQTVREISLAVMQGAGIADATMLLTASAQTLCRATGTISYDTELFGLDGQFYPGIDGDIVPQELLAALRGGAMDGIDLLTGYTNFEAGLWLQWDPDLDRADAAWIAERFGFLSAQTQAEAVAAYASFFPHEHQGVQGLHMVSDVGFAVPVTWFAEAAAARGNSVWTYRFDMEVNDKLRAMHAADLPFFFARHDSPAGIELIGPATSSAIQALRARLQTEMACALLGFIKTGSPNHAALPKWPAFNRSTGQTMIFGPQTHVASHPLGPRKQFWEDTLLARFTGQNAK